jgi:hypothetical protein
MRGQDYAVEARKRPVIGLPVKNVPRRAAKAAGLQEVKQRFLVNQPATRRIDEPGARLHAFQAPRVHHGATVLGRGTVQADNLRPGAQVVKFHLPMDAVARKGIGKGDFRAESGEKPGNGAALDVFAREPYAGPLAGLDNVILTPHIGSYAQESRIRQEVETVKNLLEELDRSTHGSCLHRL